MSEQNEQKFTETEAKAGCIAMIVAPLLAIAFIWAIWPSDGKTRAERAAELEAWTKKNEQEKAVRRANEIIHDEMIRQSVRPAN